MNFDVENVKLKNSFPGMNTFCLLFGLNKWHFKKTTAILYVCSIKFVVVFLLHNLIMQWWAHLFPILFYTTDNGKKNPKIYDISISILGHCAI